MPLPYNKDHKERSRDLRNNMTPAERVLWSRVRKKQILGLQFYRQKPIDQYVVDFYCPKANLVIEVDGGQHWEPDHAEADRERDAVLGQLKLKVLRFSNLEVMKELDSVLEQIYETARQRLPPFEKGGIEGGFLRRKPETVRSSETGRSENPPPAPPFPKGEGQK